MMNLFSLFNPSTRGDQARQEADRQNRYQYGLHEVQRWTEAKEAYIREGAEMTRQFEEQIVRHIAQWGPDSKGLAGFYYGMASYQEQTEQHIQEADYWLSFYRNIVLMKGRM